MSDLQAATGSVYHPEDTRWISPHATEVKVRTPTAPKVLLTEGKAHANEPQG